MSSHLRWDATVTEGVALGYPGRLAHWMDTFAVSPVMLSSEPCEGHRHVLKSTSAEPPCSTQNTVDPLFGRSRASGRDAVLFSPKQTIFRLEYQNSHPRGNTLSLSSHGETSVSGLFSPGRWLRPSCPPLQCSLRSVWKRVIDRVSPRLSSVGSAIKTITGLD